jgi:hypothetical protein
MEKIRHDVKTKKESAILNQGQYEKILEILDAVAMKYGIDI